MSSGIADKPDSGCEPDAPMSMFVLPPPPTNMASVKPPAAPIESDVDGAVSPLTDSQVIAPSQDQPVFSKNEDDKPDISDILPDTAISSSDLDFQPLPVAPADPQTESSVEPIEQDEPPLDLPTPSNAMSRQSTVVENSPAPTIPETVPENSAVTTPPAPKKPPKPATMPSFPPLKIHVPTRTLDEFIFHKEVGEGSFSTVAHSFDKTNQREVGIKICCRNTIIKENKFEYAYREKMALAMFTDNPHPGLPQLYGTFTDDTSLYFVMSYAPRGNLLRYIRRLTRESIQFYMGQLVAVLEYLHFGLPHGYKVVHRDIKPENMILKMNWHLMLCDFGSVKIIDPAGRNVTCSRAAAAAGSPTTKSQLPSAAARYKAKKCARAAAAQRELAKSGGDASIDTSSSDDDESSDPMASVFNEETTGSTEDLPDSYVPGRPTSAGLYRTQSFVGTPQFISPEVLTRGVITHAADLWSLGTVLYQMCTGGELAFGGASDYAIFQKIKNRDLTLPANVPTRAKDLINALIVLDPAGRLGSTQTGGYSALKNHPFFDGITSFCEDLDDDESGSSTFHWDKLFECEAPRISARSLTRNGLPIGPWSPLNRSASCADRFDHPFDSITDAISTSDVNWTDREAANGGDLAKCLYVPFNTSRTFSLTLGPQRTNSMCSIEMSSTAHGAHAQIPFFRLDTRRQLQRLAEQARANPYHRFTTNRVILRQGILLKRVHLISRKRMFLLTQGPALLYIDPQSMSWKGEIVFSKDMVVRQPNRDFRTFLIETPKRTYHLTEENGNAMAWVLDIKAVLAFYYDNADRRASVEAPNHM